MTRIETSRRSVLPSSARRIKSVALAAIYGFGCAYIVSILYLCLTALHPKIRDAVPSWIGWFGSQGSAPTISLVLALPVAMFSLSTLTGKRPFTGAPVVVLAAMAASALVLGLSSYWFHNGSQTPLFAPLTWTLGLFVGNDDQHLDGNLPVALELARLLAIATTLTTALAATLTLFRSQLDRVAIWRARSLTVIVGVDDEAVSMIRAIAQRMGHGQTLVVLTLDAEQSCVKIARSLGAKIRVAPIDDPSALTNVRMWKRLSRLYLLSEDPVQNEVRLRAVNEAMDRLGDDRFRLPLTVRIDDPWQAEVWRRSFFEADEGADSPATHNRRWVADAVGRYEISAAKLARHLTYKRVRAGAERPARTVILCGLSPLTYALTSEFALLNREHHIYPRPGFDLPSRLTIIAPDAASFVEDYHNRQRRLAPGETMLTVDAHPMDVSAAVISTILRGQDPSDYAVILSDPESATNGTRLAANFPTLRIYQASMSAATLPESTIVGRLYPFPINMDLDANAPQDVWERAAELIHESYSAGTVRTEWISQHWADLDPFLKQSNRRQVINTLWLVEKVGQHTWNTIEATGPAAPPTDTESPSPLAQLEELGFDEKTVERMIKLEHEDWFRFYKEASWNYSVDRDDVHRKHDRLLPWDELVRDVDDPAYDPTDDANRERAQKSLSTTLVILRSLGYRSIPKPWRIYRQIGEVTATKLSGPWEWRTDNGDRMTASAGDWHVVDAEGNHRSVDSAIFAERYARIEGDRYRRIGTSKARRAVAGEHIATLEGHLIASDGDWIIEGSSGEQWAVPSTQFDTSYQLVQPSDIGNFVPPESGTAAPLT